MEARSPVGCVLLSRVALFVALCVVAAPTRDACAQAPAQTDSGPATSVAESSTGDVTLSGRPAERTFGLSGKLRARLLGNAGKGVFALPFLSSYVKGKFGRPGVYSVSDEELGRPLTFIRLLPFAEKKDGRVGSYRLGFWPAEGNPLRGGAYGNPDGFIEVTQENQDTHVSEHFRLRDFLTKDQFSVWPKYLVLREELVDKLELVIAELQRSGIVVTRMTVMSGFRTPQYNQRGVGRGGRAQDSRHQYGDAADVFVDNDGDGRMDDLNRDGRVDHRDAQLILAAAERVERRYPELAGGVGVYRATRAHGPFAHVDVRGRRARWGIL